MPEQGFGLATRTTMVRARQGLASSTEAIELLASAAIEAGFATDEFTTAILAREAEYPTGLPTAVPVAIPHIHDGCLRSFLSCVTLPEPVQFASMEGDDEPLDIQIVFCFGITEPKQQAKVLRQLSVLFQNADHLNRLENAQTDAELLDILVELLGDGIVVVD
ncbi:MAG: PTS sugar transporter subunit IIA [Brooklawnia sp.]|jgi:PTS system galactitol-specific IIA component